MKKKIIRSIEHGQVIAVIPARGGSKTVPKKNIRIFQGHPLIAYSIAAAKMSQRISRVIVSTDSEEIAEIAERYGAEVPFLRPTEYAEDNSPDIDFFKHMIEWLYENESVVPEYLVHLRPTTPIRLPDDIDKAVDLIKGNTEATSLRSGSLVIHSPYKWFVKREDGYWGAILPGMTCDEANFPRQDFPEIYMPNGYVDVLKTEFIVNNNLMHGERMIGYATDIVPDIDTEEDFARLKNNTNYTEIISGLESYLKKRGN